MARDGQFNLRGPCSHFRLQSDVNRSLVSLAITVGEGNANGDEPSATTSPRIIHADVSKCNRKPLVGLHGALRRWPCRTCRSHG
jgi:hypothetical protein